MIPTVLDKKIKIIENTETANVFGNKTEGKLVKTLYANLLTLTNSEKVQAYSKDANIILSFRVISSKFTRELPYKTKDYRLVYKNQTYDILAAVPYKNNYIDIKCKVVF